MSQKIKNDKGEEIEVYTKEELEEAQKTSSQEALKPIREKMGLKDEDDFDKSFDETVKKAKERVDWEKVKGGKEKTKKEAQDAILKGLEEKGVKATINDKGEVVVDKDAQEANKDGITIEQAEAMTKKAAEDAVANDKYIEQKDTLLANLDEEKREDVDKHMQSLKDADVTGDTKQLFNMSLAALGVDAPKNMENPMGGYPNQTPNKPGDSEQEAKVDFADTDKGKRVMKDMGMTDEQITEAEKVSKDKPRMIREGRITNEKGRVASQHDVQK